VSNLSKTTYDHDEIRKWAEEGGGKPAHVKGTGGKNDPGLLRIDFPGYSGEGKLEPISWDEFFEKFDEQNLALVYQEKTADGQKSNFNKLVNRETAEQKEKSSHSSSSHSKAASGKR
jgi:anaerobic selenocysteine-containing dehydrogenase